MKTEDPLAKASPRPWDVDSVVGCVYSAVEFDGRSLVADTDPDGLDPNDNANDNAALIARAVNEYALHLDCEAIVREILEDPKTWQDDEHSFRKAVIDRLEELRNDA